MSDILQIYTESGQIPYLTSETEETELSVIIKRIQIRACDFLPFESTIKTFNGIRKFTSCDLPSSTSKILHLSLQNDFRPAQSTKNNVGIWTSSGKKELSVVNYLKFVETCDCDTFDAYSDSDTIKGSRKRLQKSVENTLKWTKDCVDICKKDFPEIVNRMVAVVAGGADFRRRQQSVIGLKKIETDSGFKFKSWVIENLEIDSAVMIYEKCLEVLPENCEILISFSRPETREKNLAIFEVMKTCYEMKKCVFQTNAFFHLADGYLGFGNKKVDESHVEPSGDDGPPVKKQKKDQADIDKVDPDFEIMDFSSVEKYKLDTGNYLLEGYSNAYLHHLQDTGEFLGKTLLVMNNLRKLVSHCNK